LRKGLWVHILRRRYAKWDMRFIINCAGLYNRLEEAEKNITIKVGKMDKNRNNKREIY